MSWQEQDTKQDMGTRGLTLAVWLMVGFALVVLGVLVKTRMTHHRSDDQKILIERSHQN